jgi:hypothetical protein
MSDYAKPTGQKFEGTSNRGDFQEALQLAIEAAIAGTSATRITWKLLDVSGANGGIVPQNDLTVTIEASGG